MERTVIFRADGNAAIGSGHIMRCLSIADAALQAGFRCVFVTAGSELGETIASHGIEHIVLGSDYRDLEAGQDAFLSIIKAHHPAALFLDSYYVTEKYLGKVHEAARAQSTNGGEAGSSPCKLVYIDDLLAFPYQVDFLLNYNIYGPDERDGYSKLYQGPGAYGGMPKLLLGPSFAPLRAEFQDLPIRAVNARAENILVSTGGADAEHMALALLEALLPLAEENPGGSMHASRLPAFHFIIGTMNGDKEKIRKIAKGRSGIILHENVSNMSRLMQESDLAISAAGSTLYELCAAQTPGITYILADNQIPGAEGFARHGVLECAGDSRVLGVGELAKRLLKRAIALSGDAEKRKAIARKMRAVVDGRGAGRVLGAVLGQDLPGQAISP